MLDEKKYILKKVCKYDKMIEGSFTVHAFGILLGIGFVSLFCQFNVLRVLFRNDAISDDLLSGLLKTGGGVYLSSFISSISISKYANFKRNYVLKKASLKGIQVTEEDVREYKLEKRSK